MCFLHGPYIAPGLQITGFIIGSHPVAGTCRAHSRKKKRNGCPVGSRRLVLRVQEALLKERLLLPPPPVVHPEHSKCDSKDQFKQVSNALYGK